MAWLARREHQRDAARGGSVVVEDVRKVRGEALRNYLTAQVGPCRI